MITSQQDLHRGSIVSIVLYHHDKMKSRLDIGDLGLKIQFRLSKNIHRLSMTRSKKSGALVNIMKTSINGPKAVFTYKISAKAWCKNCTYVFSVYTLKLHLTPALYRLSKMHLNIIILSITTLSVFQPFFLCFSRPGFGFFTSCDRS